MSSNGETGDMAAFEHMLLRIVSALVLVPLVLVLVVYAGPGLLLVALGLLGTLCLYEYFTLVRRMGVRGSALAWLPCTLDNDGCVRA